LNDAGFRREAERVSRITRSKRRVVGAAAVGEQWIVGEDGAMPVRRRRSVAHAVDFRRGILRW